MLDTHVTSRRVVDGVEILFHLPRPHKIPGKMWSHDRGGPNLKDRVESSRKDGGHVDGGWGSKVCSSDRSLYFEFGEKGGWWRRVWYIYNLTSFFKARSTSQPGTSSPLLLRNNEYRGKQSHQSSHHMRSNRRHKLHQRS